MKWLGRVFPFAVPAICLAMLASKAMPPNDAGPMHIQAARGLPVLDGGRIKPLDTFAQVTLMSISDRTTVVSAPPRINDTAIKQREAVGRTEPAIVWLLDVMAGAQAANEYEVFRIESTDLLAALHLPERQRFRYSFRDLLTPVPMRDGGSKAPLQILDEAFTKALPVDPKLRTAFEASVVELGSHVGLVQQIMRGVMPLEAPADLAQAVQPVDGKSAYNTPAAAGMHDMLTAFKAENISAFNEAVADYAQRMTPRTGDEGRRIRAELTFNNVSPFVTCIGYYVLAFVLICFGWLGWNKPLHRAALFVMLLALGVHLTALVARMYLMQRPLVFVTNLYSSAIFIAFGGVVFGLVAEWFHRNGLAMAMAAVVGFVSLIVAHILHLADTKDQLEMMQAVLDTNFWLATHVTTVTLGYSATFLAGFLGIVFVLGGVFTPWLRGEGARAVSRMIYGIICFALLLSFVGTVLGGIWADQSWGRFWGWDPKENGALMIVIWNALILHARWAGWFRQRGIAVAAIFGNIMVAWSWFGTNQLGAGLHAYGFNDQLATGLVVFGAVQLILIAVGLTPTQYWRSMATPRSLQVRAEVLPTQPTLGAS